MYIVGTLKNVEFELFLVIDKISRNLLLSENIIVGYFNEVHKYVM